MMMIQVVAYAQGRAGPLVTFGVVLAGALALVGFWNDRSRGGIETALEGPVSRRSLLGVKLVLGLATVFAAQMFVFLLFTVTALAVGRAGLTGSLVAAVTVTLAGSACLLTLTLAFSTAMGSLFFAALGTFLWLIIPRVAATIAANLTYLSGPRMTTAEFTAMTTTVTHVRWLSPITVSPPTNGQALLYAAYFALWAAAAIWTSMAWWPRVPQERLHAPFYFPWLWNLFYTLLALLTGFVLALFGRSVGFGGWTSQAHYERTLIIAVPAWFLWRWILARLGRSGLGFGPTAEL